MEIWTTPHGFLKRQLANNATVARRSGSGSEVSFTVGGKHRYVGTINAQNQVERVQTWIDNPILGDTAGRVLLLRLPRLWWRDVPGPHRADRKAGIPCWTSRCRSAGESGCRSSTSRPRCRRQHSPPVAATAEPIAPGVYYIKGGSHHSVAIDQQDHIVVVEGPLNEARSLAVDAKVKETIPNKPIRYLINSHHHFDHSGGSADLCRRRRNHRHASTEPPVLRASMGGVADAQPGSLGAIEEDRDVRDAHRQARADRRQAIDRSPSHRWQRPQRRVRDGLPARRKRS